MEEDSHSIRLTNRGRFFADEVSAQFFESKYLTHPEVKDASKLKNVSVSNLQ